jgi:hypothetical protein
LRQAPGTSSGQQEDPIYDDSTWCSVGSAGESEEQSLSASLVDSLIRVKSRRADSISSLRVRRVKGSPSLVFTVRSDSFGDRLKDGLQVSPGDRQQAGSSTGEVVSNGRGGRASRTRRRGRWELRGGCCYIKRRIVRYISAPGERR